MNAMKPNQAVLYISDVAAILGKTEAAVTSAYQRGKIPGAFKCLGKVAWHRVQFDAWLAGLSDSGAEAQADSEKKRPGRKRKDYSVQIIPISQQGSQR